jgi:pyruvate/2-oxoglutarate dehydrogenase complex dihydrolipoamide dehydrogenase (E3) component
MPNAEEYDLLVIGSGRARFLAWSLASQGKRAAVVERRYVTGSCPSIACLPSKYLIHVAKVAHYFQKGRELGIIPGDWKVEMPTVRGGKRKMVDGMVALNHERYRENGAELVVGEGRYVGPKTVEVVGVDGGTRTLRRDVVIIITWSRATIEPIPGLAEAQPMTHVEALELDRVPNISSCWVADTLGSSWRRPCGASAVESRSSSATAHWPTGRTATFRKPFICFSRTRESRSRRAYG